jgi:predicted anti-sigma-YlaC factor YlaD
MDVSKGQLCARARFWASLRIDGELSELEGALLDAHLARCDGCRTVAEGFGGAAQLLRATPPARVDPVAVHVSQSPRRLFATIAVAALLLVGVVAGSLVRGQVSHQAAPAPRAVAVVATSETPDQLRRLRRTTLLNTNTRKVPRDVGAEPV